MIWTTISHRRKHHGSLSEVSMVISGAPIAGAPILSFAIDGPFSLQAKQLSKVVTSAPDPVAEAEALLAAIREIKKSGGFDAIERNSRWRSLRKWLPDTPEKIAAYATILAVILKLLRSTPETKIEINQTFRQQFELIIKEPKKFGIQDLTTSRVRSL